MWTVSEASETTLNAPYLNYRDPRRKEKNGSENIFEEIIVENFSNMESK